MPVRIKATPTKARDLKPGDLFSIVGQATWDRLLQDPLAIGQRVYIRTNAPADVADDADEEVHKIEIVPDLTDAQRDLLIWLGKTEYSQYGECHGKDLDHLIETGLVQVHGDGGALGAFVAKGSGDMYNSVSLTEAGRAEYNRINPNAVDRAMAEAAQQARGERDG